MRLNAIDTYAKVLFIKKIKLKKKTVWIIKNLRNLDTYSQLQ